MLLLLIQKRTSFYKAPHNKFSRGGVSQDRPHLTTFKSGYKKSHFNRFYRDAQRRDFRQLEDKFIYSVPKKGDESIVLLFIGGF
jgi:hypothetical protein